MDVKPIDLIMTLRDVNGRTDKWNEWLSQLAKSQSFGETLSFLAFWVERDAWGHLNGTAFAPQDEIPDDVRAKLVTVLRGMADHIERHDEYKRPN